MSEDSGQTEIKPFNVGGATFGDGRLTVIAGPCVVESREHALMIARECQRRTRDAGLDFVFKASYDKANRSSHASYRGPGVSEGLEALRAIKEETGLPVLTDVHDVSQVEEAAAIADVLQIPAFLCRQTDLVVAACRTGRAVNVKKGQFLAPWDARNIVEKARAAGCEKLLLTERGFTFGYNNLVVDMRAFPMMRGLGVPVVFDITHSLQLPGGGDGVTAGLAEYIEPLGSAGVGAGVDGVFMEVHDNPKEAKSDGANALESTKLREVLKELLAVQRAVADAHVKP